MKQWLKLQSLSKNYYNWFLNHKEPIDLIKHGFYTIEFIVFLIENFIKINKKQVNFQTFSYQIYNLDFIKKSKKFNKKECKEWLKYKKTRRFAESSSDEE